jgi:disulfide bond formation protein DsbB
LTETITPFRATLVVFLVALAAIAGAWAFQFAGYQPCDLCLEERYAYYAGVPLALVLVFLAARGGPRPVLAAGLTLLALIFAASAVFGAYHAGVEWGFWPGPSACTGAIKPAPTMGDFLKDLNTVKVVRCDAVAIRILGLSLAVWNAVVSLVLALVAALGAKSAGRPSPRLRGEVR